MEGRGFAKAEHGRQGQMDGLTSARSLRALTRGGDHLGPSDAQVFL